MIQGEGNVVGRQGLLARVVGITAVVPLPSCLAWDEEEVPIGVLTPERGETATGRSVVLELGFQRNIGDLPEFVVERERDRRRWGGTTTREMRAGTYPTWLVFRPEHDLEEDGPHRFVMTRGASIAKFGHSSLALGESSSAQGPLVVEFWPESRPQFRKLQVLSPSLVSLSFSQAMDPATLTADNIAATPASSVTELLYDEKREGHALLVRYDPSVGLESVVIGAGVRAADGAPVRDAPLTVWVRPPPG